jgi:hypothetical protein
MNFQAALRQAADEALEERNITNAQHKQLYTVAGRGNRLRAAEALVRHRAKTTDKAAIDWANLVNLIKELLPVILQLIALFK